MSRSDRNLTNPPLELLKHSLLTLLIWKGVPQCAVVLSYQANFLFGTPMACATLADSGTGVTQEQDLLVLRSSYDC